MSVEFSMRYNALHSRRLDKRADNIVRASRIPSGAFPHDFMYAAIESAVFSSSGNASSEDVSLATCLASLYVRVGSCGRGREVDVGILRLEQALVTHIENHFWSLLYRLCASWMSDFKVAIVRLQVAQADRWSESQAG